jgi:hypothetical protein
MKSSKDQGNTFMGRKTYREYRESESVKFPALAWLLDRKIIYIATMLVAVIALGSYLKTGWDSYNQAIKEPEAITPYADIQPSSFAGKTWAEKLLATNPANLKNWTVDKSTKPKSAVDLKVCSKIPTLSTSLLSTHVANSDQGEVRVQVYGAGQAAKEFTNYASALKTCFGSDVEETKNSKFVIFPRGFIITAGDAIIGVYTSDDSVRDALFDFYSKNMETSLIESSCLALISSPQDANRSLFYNPKDYTGLSDSQNLETAVDITGLPTPTSLKLDDVKDDSATIPEAPLPKDFPTLPKTVVSKPTIPAALKNENAFTGVAEYHAPDTKGPGCGWEWTAQVAPEVDLKKLAKEKSDAIVSTQTSLDNKALGYVDGKINWALQVASLAPSVDVWNTFVNETNLVHDKWNWLKSERNKLEPAWREYVADHDEWLSFDQRKADALKKFDEEFKQCQKDEKDLADWKKDWQKISDDQAKDKAKADADAKDSEKNKPTASPSATPTPTPSATPSASAVTSPPKPAGCSTPPVEPEIATQAKPAEPKAPSIPEGVTIPASWPTPKTS